LNRAIAEGVVEPDTAAVIRRHVAQLRKLIADALRDGLVTPVELRAVKRAWSSLSSELKSGVEAALRAAALARIVRATIKAALRDGIVTDAELSAIDSKMRNLRGKLAAHLKALVKTIQDSRSAADDAWGKLKDTILSAFDEQVVGRVGLNRQRGDAALNRATAQKAVDRAGGKIASIETGGVSPVMAAIKAKGKALVDAYDAFIHAEEQAQGKAGADALERAAGVLAEARDQWDGLAGEWTDVEVAYHDAWQRMIDGKAALAQDAIDQYQKEQETKAKLARKALEKDLNAIYGNLRAGKITLEQAQQQIDDLLAPFGLSLADLGNMLDNSDLTDALSELKDAIDELTKALKGLGGVAGAPPPRVRPRQLPGDDTTRRFAALGVGGGRMDTRIALPAGLGGRGSGGDTYVFHIAPPTVQVQGSLIATSEQALAERLAPLIRDPVVDEIGALGQRNGGTVPGWRGRVTP
jgi:hypothetical protein